MQDPHLFVQTLSYFLRVLRTNICRIVLKLSLSPKVQFKKIIEKTFAFLNKICFQIDWSFKQNWQKLVFLFKLNYDSWSQTNHYIIDADCLKISSTSKIAEPSNFLASFHLTLA